MAHILRRISRPKKGRVHEQLCFPRAQHGGFGGRGRGRYGVLIGQSGGDAERRHAQRRHAATPTQRRLLRRGRPGVPQGLQLLQVPRTQGRLLLQQQMQEPAQRKGGTLRALSMQRK